MKTELNRYTQYQIYLLNDGRFALISDIEPASKLKPDESDRRCAIKLGHKHVKGEEFRKSNIMVVENEPTNTVIAIDVSVNLNMTISSLRKSEARYTGTLTDEKIKEYNRICSEYIKNLE
jgi:hypothetical protein